MNNLMTAALALAITAIPVVAQADDRRSREYRDHQEYRHDHRRNNDHVVGAIIGGVLGAIVGSNRRYRDDYYYAGDGYYYDRRGGGDFRHGYENYNHYGWRDRRDSRYRRR